MYTKSEYLDELKSIRNAYLDDHMAYVNIDMKYPEGYEDEDHPDDSPTAVMRCESFDGQKWRIPFCICSEGSMDYWAVDSGNGETLDVDEGGIFIYLWKVSVSRFALTADFSVCPSCKKMHTDRETAMLKKASTLKGPEKKEPETRRNPLGAENEVQDSGRARHPILHWLRRSSPR